MNEQFKPESMESPAKYAEQLYTEFNQTHDELMRLMEQVLALDVKANEDGLLKEEFDSIAKERNKLAAQFNEKCKYNNTLKEQWQKMEHDVKLKLEEKYKKLNIKN